MLMLASGRPSRYDWFVVDCAMVVLTCCLKPAPCVCHCCFHTYLVIFATTQNGDVLGLKRIPGMYAAGIVS